MRSRGTPRPSRAQRLQNRADNVAPSQAFVPLRDDVGGAAATTIASRDDGLRKVANRSNGRQAPETAVPLDADNRSGITARMVKSRIDTLARELWRLRWNRKCRAWRLAKLEVNAAAARAAIEQLDRLAAIAAAELAELDRERLAQVDDDTRHWFEEPDGSG